MRLFVDRALPASFSSFRSSNQTGSRHPCAPSAHPRHLLKYPCELRPQPEFHGLQVLRAPQPYAFARVSHQVGLRNYSENVAASIKCFTLGVLWKRRVHRRCT